MRTHCTAWIAGSLGAALTVAAAGQSNPETTDAFMAPSTQAMAEMLVETADGSNIFRNYFANRAQADALRTRLEADPSPQARLALGFQLAQQLMYAGDTESSINELVAIFEVAQQNPQLVGPRFYHRLKGLLAVAYLRLGEQQNCIANHTTDSCLLPIQGGGVHVNPQPSQSAIMLLEALIKEAPSHLGYRWLLNVAKMTTGEYPDGVPEAQLIPPEAFESDYDITRFVDVAGGLGIDTLGLAGGVAVDDFDGDGDLDLFASSFGVRDQLRFYRNNGDGTFTERTTEAGLTGLTGGLNLVQADFDNDGHLDLFVPRGAWLLEEGLYPNSLIRNNGDGTFTDVTVSANLLSRHPTQTAAWGDFDNDGWLDLFIGNESGHPVNAAGWDAALASGEQEGIHPCELYRNNGDGTFTEMASAVGVNLVTYVKAAVWGDYDNDGRLDLYLSTLGGGNTLYHNDGPRTTSDDTFAWSFSDRAFLAGVAQPDVSFPAWFWDYDNDGWLDLYVAGYGLNYFGDIAASYLGEPHGTRFPALYRNTGKGRFTDVAAEAGLHVATLPMGANFGDLDNDGYLDFYVGTGDPSLEMLIPNLMFRNDGTGVFQNVTTSGGFGHLQKGHGIAFADLDNDGDQDVYTVMGGAYEGDIAFNALFLNPGHGNHWVTLRLVGTRSNRSAIGARIKIVVDGPNGPREIHRVVGSGGSFGANSLQQEIGLGRATSLRSIEITWPTTGVTQVVQGAEMDRILEITEGDPKARHVHVPVLTLDGKGGGGHEHHHHHQP